MQKHAHSQESGVFLSATNPPSFGIVGFTHHTHSAFTNFLQYSIVRNSCTDHQSFIPLELVFDCVPEEGTPADRSRPTKLHLLERSRSALTEHFQYLIL